MSVDITVNETVNDVEIVVQPNVIEVNVTRTSGGGGGAVDSVNGQTGAVVLDADDISSTSTTNKFVTASEKTAITHSNRSTLDAITEAFTTSLKTAYDSAVSWISTNGANTLSHIASASNPHSTTAAQVGAYTTTQVDGLLALKADKFYIERLQPSSYVTGTTVETEVLKITIPANTFSATDLLKLHRIVFQKIGTGGSFTTRFKLSTSATMPSGTTDQIGVNVSSNTSLYSPFTRTLFITGGNILGFPFTTNSVIDNNVSTTAISSAAFDRTVTQYLYVSVTLGSAADQVRILGGEISNI